MRLERLRAGQQIRADDLNRIIEAVNQLRITVGEGLRMSEGTGGITLALDSGPEKKVAVGTP